jgi:hypothetical protein
MYSFYSGNGVDFLCPEKTEDDFTEVAEQKAVAVRN